MGNKFKIDFQNDNLLNLSTFVEKVYTSILPESGEDEKLRICDLETGMKDVNKFLKSLNLSFSKLK